MIMPDDLACLTVKAITGIVDRACWQAIRKIMIVLPEVPQMAGWPFAVLAIPEFRLDFDIGSMNVAGIHTSPD